MGLWIAIVPVVEFVDEESARERVVEERRALRVLPAGEEEGCETHSSERESTQLLLPGAIVVFGGVRTGGDFGLSCVLLARVESRFVEERVYEVDIGLL